MLSAEDGNRASWLWAEDQRREAAEKEAATRRVTDAQVLEDAERSIGPIGLIGSRRKRKAQASNLFDQTNIPRLATIADW